MKTLDVKDLRPNTYAPLYECLTGMIPEKIAAEILERATSPNSQHILLGMLNNVEVVGLFYNEAAESLGSCSSCGATLTDKAYAVREPQKKFDRAGKTVVICPHCLDGLPTERQRIDLFEWMGFAEPTQPWSASQLGAYHSCEPWRSSLFIPGLIKAGENVEVFPPTANPGPLIRPQVRCDDPEQRAPRGLMRRVFYDFRFGVVGNIGMEGMDRLKSMNEDTIFDRNFAGMECQPDGEMITLLKRTILNNAPVKSK